MGSNPVAVIFFLDPRFLMSEDKKNIIFSRPGFISHLIKKIFAKQYFFLNSTAARVENFFYLLLLFSQKNVFVNWSFQKTMVSNGLHNRRSQDLSKVLKLTPSLILINLFSMKMVFPTMVATFNGNPHTTLISCYSSTNKSRWRTFNSPQSQDEYPNTMSTQSEESLTHKLDDVMVLSLLIILSQTETETSSKTSSKWTTSSV